MFCSECGKQVADDAKFCGECGAVQTTAGLETTATAFNRMQSCPSCNVKGWEHGKRCGNCRYVEGREVANRNKLQASVTSPSSGKSSSIGIFLLWALIIVTAIFALKHFQKQTETAQVEQSNQVENVSTQNTEEKARLAAEGERMRAASVEREKTVGKMEQEQLSSEADAASVERARTSIKEAIFRTNGAWVEENAYNNISHNCGEIVPNSDAFVSFINFTHDEYIFRMRVGARSNMWGNPVLAESVRKMDSTYARLAAKVSFDGSVAIVTTFRSDGDVTQWKYRFNQNSGVLENFDVSCVVCKDDLYNSLLYYQVKNGGIKTKFCSGSYN